MKLTKKQLQASLTGLAKANNKARVYRDLIHQHCIVVYGVDPSEIDNDDFIDACDGGCGIAPGMTVDEFDESMKQSFYSDTGNEIKSDVNKENT